MSEILAAGFWVALASVIYVYAGFPLLVILVGNLRRRPVFRRRIEPSVSLIIAAYNEENVIEQRLENALALDYPLQKLEIIVASDGSDDGTDALVAACAARRVRLLSLPRSGKLMALHQAVQRAQGDILVFSDANTLYHPQALRALVRNFADPAVGGVAGHTAYRLKPQSQSSSHGENLYWRYDTWLKQLESATGSVVSAHGGMYAIRRSLYRPVSDPAVTDDFAISTAVIEQGYRLVFEPQALAYESAVPEAGREFSRRVRLMTRGWRSVLLRKKLLNPFRYGFYSIVFFSHKVLRRLVPVSLLALLLCGAALSSQHATFFFAALAQSLFYGLAAVGWLLRAHGAGRWKCFYVPFFFCFGNSASLVALLRFLRGDRIRLWRPQRHEVQA